MRLNNLPVDILTPISGLLIPDNESVWHPEPASYRDIINFALTCRPIGNVAKYHIVTNADIPARKLPLFLRSVLDDPAYGRNIRYLKICGPTQRNQNGDDFGCTRAALQDLISHLSALRVLHLHNWWLPMDIISSRTVPFWNTLQDVMLDDFRDGSGAQHNLETSQLIALLEFPRLRSLKVSNFEETAEQIKQTVGVLHVKDTSEGTAGFPNPKPGQECDAPPSLSPNASLKGLGLPFSQISHPVMHGVLDRCRKLESLAIQVPYNGEYECFRPLTFKNVDDGCIIEEMTIRIKKSFSSKPIARSLAPLTTLTNLSLTASGQWWDGHDNSRLDLSNFAVLRTLEAPAQLFLPTLLPRSLWVGCADLLPSSLNHLLLSWGFESGVFFQLATVEEPPHVRDHSISSGIQDRVRDTWWLMELALQCSSKFSELRSVTLWEEVKAMGIEHFQHINMNPPPDIDGVFSAAGCELSLILRRPPWLSGV